MDRDQHVATINGGTLPIRFRIETAPPPPPPPPTGWEDGDIVTYTQTEGGNSLTAAGILLLNHFDAIYSTFGFVEVGIPGTAGFSMLFTGATRVFAYQPASGPPASLNADLVDPTSTASGEFGGHVLALRFNLDLSDAGVLLGGSGIRIGDLTMCGLSVGGLNGTTVRSLMNTVNTALGGGTTPYAITDLNTVVAAITVAFQNGEVSLFAQDHIVNGPCP